MHKYRAAAKQAAWYSEENDSPNYNPFRKIRSYEHDLRTLHRAQPLQLSASPSAPQSDEEVEKDGENVLSISLTSPAVLTSRTENATEIQEPLDEEQGGRRSRGPTSAFAYFKSWSRQKLSPVWRQIVLASGSHRSGDVKRTVADMGRSVISHAPLGTKGLPFLQIPGRRSRFMVIEYAKQDGDIFKSTQESADITRDSTRLATGATTGVRMEVPPLRFYEKQSPRDDDRDISADHQGKSNVQSLRAELLECLSSKRPFPGSPDLRIIYIQDDLESLHHIHEVFHIGFARHRHKIDFLQWSTGNIEEDTEQQAAQQTDFWRPTEDRGSEIVRTAFGLEYLVPQPLISFDTSENEGKSRQLGAKNSKMVQPVPDYGLQRLSVYIQLNKAEDNSLQLGRFQKVTRPFTLDHSVIVYDSMYKGVPTGELISGRAAWQHLYDDLEVVDTPLLSAIIQLIFDTIAGKWSAYVLSMHNHVAALEEIIYDQPADDRRAPALWGISKQLLQAERLMKFHVLLLENVQRDLTDLTGNTTRPNWLGQNLAEFNRLSSEVEETLKKPVANMVDLMYKSISIRDARQSLELNTSMWRLSWITFIFLPLTFLAGVFGMNVSELTSNPPLKWYFIVASPLMVLVMISWLSARRWMRKDVDTSSRLMNESSQSAQVKAGNSDWARLYPRQA